MTTVKTSDCLSATYSSRVQKSLPLTIFSRLSGGSFVALFVCFVCFLGFIVVVFNLVWGFTFFKKNSLSFFLLAEICMTSFRDKLFGIADQWSLFCCWGQIFCWVCATLCSKAFALPSQRGLWRSHGEWESSVYLYAHYCSQGKFLSYDFIIFCGLTWHENKGGLFFLSHVCRMILLSLLLWNFRDWSYLAYKKKQQVTL